MLVSQTAHNIVEHLPPSTPLLFIMCPSAINRDVYVIHSTNHHPYSAHPDLPVMKEPAWQKLASGALSPATTLGDFIRQAEPQDNNTRATTNAVTPTQTMGETLVGSPQPTHAEITQAQTTEAQTKMEKEDAGRIDDLISQMVVARDDASREVRGAAVEPQHDTQAQMQRQDGEDTHHNVLPPEPVFVAGMGIAR